MYIEDNTTPVSPAATIQETLTFLQSLGLSAVPIAPYFPPEEYPSPKDNTRPEFTGKNPSWLDRSVPKIIKHERYRRQQPTAKELKRWFTHTQGVCVLAGQENIIQVDFDRKRFLSQQACNDTVQNWISTNNLQDTWIERTVSGGWHIAIEVEEMPTFTNFWYEGEHRGEILSNAPCVIAPTPGYTIVNRVKPIKLKNLDGLGLSPKTVDKVETLSSVDLEISQLISQSSFEILTTGKVPGDRSEVATALVKEWHGWKNWLDDHDIPYQNDDGLLEAIREDWGLEDKFDRVIESIDLESCEPALLGEGPEAVWLKVGSVNPQVMESFCPRGLLKRIKARGGRGNVVQFPTRGDKVPLPEVSYYDALWERMEFEKGLEETEVLSSRNAWAVEVSRAYEQEQRRSVDTILGHLEDIYGIQRLKDNPVEIPTIDPADIRALWAVFDPQMNVANALERQGLGIYLGLQCMIACLGVVISKTNKHWVAPGLHNPPTKHLICYGDTSSGKDVVSKIFKAPLIKMDGDAERKQKERLDRYRKVRAATKKMSDAELQKLKEEIAGYESEELLHEFIRGQQADISQEFQGRANFWLECPCDLKLEDFEVPVQRQYLFTEGSPEGIRNKAAFLKHPILWSASEMTTVYRSLIGQGGSDFSELPILGWNGEYFKQVKANGGEGADNNPDNISYTPSGELQFSLIGNIQNDVLKSLITINDPEGKTARNDFIDVSVNNFKPLRKRDKEGASMVDTCGRYLDTLYSHMDKDSEQYQNLEIDITDAASDMWVDYFEKMQEEVERQAKAGNQAYARWLAKLAQKAAHECVAIHWMRVAHKGLGLLKEDIDPMMQDETSMKVALKLAEISRITHIGFFKEFGDGESLEGELAWLYSYLVKKGCAVPVRSLQQMNHFKDRKVKITEIRQYLDHLCKMGKATQTPEGYKAIT